MKVMRGPTIVVSTKFVPWWLLALKFSPMPPWGEHPLDISLVQGNIEVNIGWNIFFQLFKAFIKFI